MSLPAPPPAASLPPTLAPLATPPAHHVAQTAFSTLLLTLPLPLLASSRVASARRYEKERLMAEEGLVPDEFRNGSPAIGSTAAGAAKDEDEERAAVNLQLESLGFRVGGDLAERCVSGLAPALPAGLTGSAVADVVPFLLFLLRCRCLCISPGRSCCRLAFSKPRFTDSLDIVKFVCKDVWTAAFNKQIDNLRTNHRVRRLCSGSSEDGRGGWARRSRRRGRTRSAAPADERSTQRLRLETALDGRLP